MKPFYITTPIYYANASPHIGHAYTTVVADALARFHRLNDRGAFLLTGMDEHGGKIQEKALTEGIEPQKLVDGVAEEFRALWEKLDISFDNFIRTTDEKHKRAVSAALQYLYDRGAIYKGTYEGLYCVGCEQFKSESDLREGKCPDHDRVPEKMSEESYMLKMSVFQDELLESIETDRLKIRPEQYKREVVSFLRGNELADLSVSRRNVEWGIPLPFDPEHTSYVWFDAFLNYLTGIGWEGPGGKVPVQWPADIHLIGKDILRVHAVIWPIMLLHLGVELPRAIFAGGHILSGGKKMSKSLGNVIGIDDLLERFGVDGTRYLLLSAGKFGKDMDVTMEALVDKYNNDLANGLGNLLSRVLTLGGGKISSEDVSDSERERISAEVCARMKEADTAAALAEIWNLVEECNKYLEETKPWLLRDKEPEKFASSIGLLLGKLRLAGELLTPFLPQSAGKIKQALKTGEKIILFERVK